MGMKLLPIKLSNIYDYPDYRLVQFNLGVLSHYSYMIISGNEVLVVDPGRDISAYLDLAKKENVKIIGRLPYPQPCRFRGRSSGTGQGRRLSLCMPAPRAATNFPIRPCKEGSKIEVGDAVVNILETPGHTPDGLCGLVAPKKQPDKPNLILTGDVLFIGSVGRPDLMGGSCLRRPPGFPKLRHLDPKVE